MSPFLRKTLICLAALAVGTVTGELFFVVVAMGWGGIQALAVVPLKGLLPMAAILSALAVGPWPLIGGREGYGPLWFSSLLISVGFGIIAGFMVSLLHNEMPYLELNVLLHAGFAFCAAFFACLTLHLSGVFKQSPATA